MSIVSICGLEECAMHIGNPKMRGWLGGGAAGIKRQLMSILYVNYRQFFSICGLEECATHISNPKMRGCLGGGAAGILLIALDSATTCGRFVCYILSPHAETILICDILTMLTNKNNLLHANCSYFDNCVRVAYQI